MSLRLGLSLSESGSASFSELEVNYPVSCVISDIVDKRSKLVYCGSYGGGMISGDRYLYNIFVGKDSRLLIRSTSSTKVYKRIEDRTTCQIFKISLEEGSYLSMIPEPLVCYKDSTYFQTVSINLSDSSNLIYLDWFNCGRATRENWEFQSLTTETILLMKGTRILCDRLHLENSIISIQSRMSFYEIFATLFIIGPKTIESQEHIYALDKVPPVLWYCSKIPDCQGLVVKMACVNKEILHDFIRNKLLVLEGDLFWDS
jgi:urease accessory protein